jgi:hypothetical protein
MPTFLNRIRSASAMLVKGVALAWLPAHFALTALLVLPLNPIKAQYETFLHRDFGRFFSQNWSLFAPNPINVNSDLLARCMSESEFRAFDGKTHPTTGWANLTAPVLRHHQENRFSAYDRLSRPQSNFVRGFVSGSDSQYDALRMCQGGDENACRLYQRMADEQRRIYGPMLARVASAYCKETNPGSPPYAVALRMHQAFAQPWSKREEGSAASTVVMELGVYPYARDVVEPHIYRGDTQL